MMSAMAWLFESNAEPSPPETVEVRAGDFPARTHTLELAKAIVAARGGEVAAPDGLVYEIGFSQDLGPQPISVILRHPSGHRVPLNYGWSFALPVERLQAVLAILAAIQNGTLHTLCCGRTIGGRHAPSHIDVAAYAAQISAPVGVAATHFELVNGNLVIHFGPLRVEREAVDVMPLDEGDA